MQRIDSIFLELFHMGVSAIWLILAVCMLRLVLKKAPKNMICLLWALAAIRLICPFSFESAWSLIPTHREIITHELIYAQEPVVETGIPAVDAVLAPTVTGSLTPQGGDSVNPIQVYIFLAEMLWIAGMAVMLLYAGISRWVLGRRIRLSVPDREAGVRLCDAIDTPFILGMLRPRIYLPSAMEEEHRRYVLAHERAHIRRGDPVWKLLGFGLLTLHWYNPFCWLAYILFSRDLELACDEKVIRSGTVEYKKEYSRALLTCSVPSHKKVFCPLAFGEVGVKARIENVLRYKKPARWLIVAAIAALAIVMVCFMTDRQPLPDEEMIFGTYYEAYQNVYSSPPLTESDHEIQYLPMFDIRADHGFARKHELHEGAVWEETGYFEEYQLTKDNFDVLFREEKKNENGPWSWPEDEGWFRRNNYKAWRVVGEDVFYLLLLQKDGSVLLAEGYYDAEGETDPYSDDSAVRWMVLLRELALSTIPTENKAGTPYQWTNNITSEQVEWVSVTVWDENAAHHQVAQSDIEQLTSILRKLTPDQVFESDLRKQHTVSVMVYCYGREYLLQYVGDGVVHMAFDSATAEMYEDKRWAIEDEKLGEWMEQWNQEEKIKSVE